MDGDEFDYGCNPEKPWYTGDNNDYTDSPKHIKERYVVLVQCLGNDATINGFLDVDTYDDFFDIDVYLYNLMNNGYQFIKLIHKTHGQIILNKNKILYIRLKGNE